MHARSRPPPLCSYPGPRAANIRSQSGNTYSRPGYTCGDHDLLTANAPYNADYYAIDFEFTVDQPVSAAAAGTVLEAKNTGDGYGNRAVIDHGGGFISLYGHLDYFAAGIQQGAAVSQGQILGYADNTGQSQGTHLHFHIMQGSTAYKPEPMSGVSGFGQWGSCYTSTYSPFWTATPSSWQGWENWGAYADGSPIAIAYDDARPDFIWEVKRTGGDIFVRRWNPGWTSWQNISNLGSDPIFDGNVAISDHEGTVRVIAQSSSMVYLKQWISGNSWYNWSDVSLGSPVPGSIAISNGPNGRIDIVGVASNKMWIKWYEGGVWYGWQDLSGASPITGVVAVSNRGGLTHVVGWAGGHAWLKWKIGATWYGWQDLASPVDNTFLAIDNANALSTELQSVHHGVHIAALAGGSTWVRCWDIDCAPGWNHLGAPGTGPVAIANDTFEVNVVTKDSGWSLWHTWWGSPHQ